MLYDSILTINYHGKTVGDYLSFLYNTGVEANSCHLFLMKRINDQVNGYGYSQVGDLYELTSTIVPRLSDSKTSAANVEFKLQIDMPTIDYTGYTNVDNDNKVYFMLYIPIWYQDTDVNQNEEMDSFLKIVSTVIVPVEEN